MHRVDDSYPESEVLEAFRGQDAVVCALGFANLLPQITFINAAVKVGVRWFIPAEFGGNKAAALQGERLPLHDAKEAVHRHLIKTEAEGLSWTAVATGPFIDWYVVMLFSCNA